MNCSSRWLNGPSFLHLQKSDLPSQDILKARNSNVLIFHALQTNMHSVNKCPIDIARFSNWNCVVRVAAYCFFFLDRLKKQSNCSSLAHHTDWLTSTPSALHIVKTSETRFSLKKARRYCRQGSKDALSFFNGRKEFRAKGRMSKAVVLETTRHPLILDDVNPIVKFFIRNTHVVNSHSGIEQTRSF